MTSKAIMQLKHQMVHTAVLSIERAPYLHLYVQTLEFEKKKMREKRNIPEILISFFFSLMCHSKAAQV